MSFEERYATAHELVLPLSDDETVAFGRVLGRLIDGGLAKGTGLLVQAVKARSALLCPDDALHLVGAARALERYESETDDAYRARLVLAFDAHSWAGTAKGIQDQIEAALAARSPAYTPVVTVLENWNGAYSDGADWYSRIAVVIQCGNVWIGSDLGGGWVLGTTVLGSTATANEVASMKRIVRKWKDCGAYPGVLRVVLADTGVLGIDFVLGTSELADPAVVTEWVMGPLFGSTWFLGSSPLADYEI